MSQIGFKLTQAGREAFERRYNVDLSPAAIARASEVWLADQPVAVRLYVRAAQRAAKEAADVAAAQKAEACRKY